MKQLVIHFPDGKSQFVMELLRSLGYVKIDPPSTSTFIITDEQRALVDEAFKKLDNNPGYALDWDDAKHQLIVD